MYNEKFNEKFTEKFTHMSILSHVVAQKECLYRLVVAIGEPCSHAAGTVWSQSVAGGEDVVRRAAVGDVGTMSVPARSLICASLDLSPTAGSFASIPEVRYPLLERRPVSQQLRA